MKYFLAKLAILAALLMPAALAENIFFVTPSNLTLTVGQTLTLEVWIDGYTDLTFLQYDLQWAGSALLGPPSESSLALFGDPLSYSFSAFTSSLTFADAMVGFGPGFTSGSPFGTARFSFVTLTPGELNFSLDNIELYDSAFMAIAPGTPVGGTVQILPNAIPEPSTYLLSLGALLGGCILRRRAAPAEVQARRH